MIANFHTHTARCGHAEGRTEDYIENAITGGLQVLGFSDHTPYWYPEGWRSKIRMGPEDLPAYLEEITRLKEQYAGKIGIHLGLEAEFYPGLFSDLLERLKDTPVEYLLLGQHFLYNEKDAPYSGAATEDKAILTQYCDQAIEGMYTGLFSYMAHPDLVRFEGDENIYRAEMTRLCKAANECKMPLEINLLGLRLNRHYPRETFWEIAAEYNCSVILGSDAHDPKGVCVPETEAEALAMANKLGLKVVDSIDFRLKNA
ncbi:MAG: histidinol-phosphatase [Oscillospiraceae bacterium]|nr:histidinol-phosphatase [Oscillospiraceae bacterium]MBQ7341539.1 histidinol-phosphatase [Oscillospiraceae bacterium]